MKFGTGFSSSQPGFGSSPGYWSAVANHLALLHRARTALEWPDGLMDKQALLRDLNAAIEGAYPRRHRGYCWCQEPAVDGHHCTEHSEFEVGDG